MKLKSFIVQHWRAATFAVIALLVLIGYAPIFEKQFVQEDYVQVGIRHFDALAAAQSDEWLPLALKWGFIAPVTKRAVIRVVRDWTLWVDYFAWGLNPVGYQLTNLLLHIVNSFLVTLLMWRLTKKEWTAALAGLLFAVMSIHPEAVADIPSRGHELAALTMVMALIFYTRLPSRTALVGGVVSFVLGLLSVETVMTLPLLLVVYELVYNRAEGWRAMAKRLAPFWAILFVYAGIRVLMFGRGGGTPTFDAAASVLFFWSGYTQYLTDPFITDIAVWQAIAVNLVLLVFLVAYRKRREVVFGLLWLPIPLLVTLAFPPQERYFYVPSVGLALALAGILVDPLPRLKFSRALGLALSVLLLLFYTVSLYRLNENWRNTSRLAHTILAEVKALQPEFPDNANIVFVGLPEQVRRAPVFMDPLNIQYAIMLTYDNPTLKATSADAFPPFAENPERTFYFEYDERTLSERTDLEAQLRQNLSCGNGVQEIAWNFDAAAQDWSEWNEIANAQVKDGMWQMDAVGSDPILGSPLVNVRGSRLGTLKIAMKVRAATSPLHGEVYWRTRGMEDFSPALVTPFEVTADGAMHTYEIALPVARNDVIAQLRLDPTDAPAQLAIDSVTLACK